MAINRDKVARTALKFVQKGQFQKAIDEYKRVLATDPRDIRTRLKLIDLYGRAGKRREAIDECLQVAESYSDQGFYLKAIAVYKQALRIDPENPDLYRQMGEMYVRQGLVGDALGAFKRGVEVYRRQGNQEDAQDLLLRMEEMAPENAAIKIHLAELYLADGNYEAFEAELGKIIAQLRGEGRSRKLLAAVESYYETSNHHPSVLRKLAELYVDLGEEDKALEVIREGLASSPTDRDLRLLALRAHLVLGQLPDARRLAQGLFEEDPNDLFILEQLAAIAQARGDQRELAETYRTMAKVYGRKGLTQKEEDCFRKVREIVPDDAEARVSLGELIVEPEEVPAGPDGGATFESERRDDQPAGEGAIREGLVEAELYLKYGIEEKAAEKLAELVALAPNDLEIRQKLRDLHRRRGDQERWVAEQLQIAKLFFRDKRENEALRAYEAVLEVAPDNPDASRGIRLLRPDVAVSTPKEIEVDLDGATIEFVEEGGAERAARPKEAAAAPDAEERLREGLSEADFYEAQGLVDEALRVLRGLLEDHPGSANVRSRVERLGGDRAAADAEEESGFVDLQAEVLDASSLNIGSGFEGFQDFEVSELDDIVREFKSGIAERLGEEDYETHYNLGMAYREMGLLDDAAQEFQLAARFPDKARDAYSSLALVYQELDRAEEAYDALGQALGAPDNGPEDRAAILYEMGGVAERSGDWSRALQAFQQVAQIDPGHRDVSQRIRRLEGLGGA